MLDENITVSETLTLNIISFLPVSIFHISFSVYVTSVDMTGWLGVYTNFLPLPRTLPIFYSENSPAVCFWRQKKN